MNLYVFNVALIVAWVLLTAGGLAISLAAGLLLGGASLLLLTLLAVFLAGGVVSSAAPEQPGA